ncbi:hypothetical protein SERLA73DRAFT_190604, partial [Serpula lacrymans var. lacrymans S7.3]
MSLPSPSSPSHSSALPSPPSSDGGYYTSAHPPPEAIKINEVLTMLKGALGSLGVSFLLLTVLGSLWMGNAHRLVVFCAPLQTSFDALKEQTAQVALLGGEFE